MQPPIPCQRILVTGASKGIGAAIARRLGATGAVVGIHFRQDESSAHAVADAVRAGGGTALLLEGDLLDAGVRDGLIDRFVAYTGGIDALVNNAGAVFDYIHFSELTQAAWNASMALNAQAPLWLARAAWPHFKAAGGGRIVNISSAAVRYGGSVNALHYTAAKAALEATSTLLAREGAAHNILVNTIRCGVIDTDMHRHIPGYGEQQFASRLRLIPLARPGRPEEVAGLVSYFLSPEGSFTTGQTVAVAGGD